MADDIDIEAMLEAPYKKDENKLSSANGHEERSKKILCINLDLLTWKRSNPVIAKHLYCRGHITKKSKGPAQWTIYFSDVQYKISLPLKTLESPF
uniref:RNA binding motif protein 39 n=1 Tax=Nomascus leucogenys TaxID=61853 RepID=A0A2I3FTX1_NOMLE